METPGEPQLGNRPDGVGAGGDPVGRLHRPAAVGAWAQAAAAERGGVEREVVKSWDQQALVR